MNLIYKALSDNVIITRIIKNEFGKPLPNWIKVKSPTSIHYRQILEMNLDAGEASAIALSLDMENAILIIDDLKGRRVANRLRLRFSGTFGLILRAKQEGIVPTIQPILNKVRETNFRFDENLFETVLREAGE